MKIMIIGGTNFIGPVLSEQLSQAGHDICLFHRKNTPNIPFLQIQGNNENAIDLAHAISTFMPDTVIHMTALFERNITALEAGLDGHKTRVIIISSCDVYKAYQVLWKLSDIPIVALPLNEESPLRDVMYPYRNMVDMEFYHYYDKILVERAAIQSPAIDAVIVRLGIVYGKNDPNHRFQEPIMLMKNKNKSIELPKQFAADFRVSKCYVEDVAFGIRLIVEKGLSNEIYNLCASETPTEKEWYECIAKLMKWDGVISVNQKAIPQVDLNYAQNMIMDSNKIRLQLGYKEPTSFEQGLLNTIQWEIDNAN